MFWSSSQTSVPASPIRCSQSCADVNDRQSDLAETSQPGRILRIAGTFLVDDDDDDLNSSTLYLVSLWDYCRSIGLAGRPRIVWVSFFFLPLFPACRTTREMLRGAVWVCPVLALRPAPRVCREYTSSASPANSEAGQTLCSFRLVWLVWQTSQARRNVTPWVESRFARIKASVCPPRICWRAANSFPVS